MARPYWSGQLRLALVSCGISLTSAVTEVEKVKLNRIKRGSETQLRQQMVDPETGATVDKAEQSLGFQYEKGRFVEISPDEIEALKIESSEVIVIERVVPESAIDWLYYDKPYFVTPNDKNSLDVFAVIRDALKAKQVVGIGRMAVARRESPVLIKASGRGMILTTLRDPQEVRSEAEVFDDIVEMKPDKQNLALAETLIQRMAGAFDLSMFEDRYQAALRELVEAKVKGQQPRSRKAAPAPGKYGDLFQALKASIDTAPSEIRAEGRAAGKVTPIRAKAKPAAPSRAGKPAPAAKGRKRA
jgi:DNA end-binding protein Ku